MEITGKGAGTAPQGQCLAGSPGFISSLPGEQKNISDFCDRCEPFDCMADYPPAVRRHNIFMDRLGIMWICSGWKNCEHSVILNGKIHSCRVRGKQIKDQDRGRPDAT